MAALRAVAVTNLLQLRRRSFLPSYLDGQHSFQGNDYFSLPVVSSAMPNEERASADFVYLVEQAYKANAVVYACEMTRVSLFSEARFQWRQVRNGRPGDLFGTRDLAVLERPWPGGTTGDLLGRMITDADFGGTAFVARQFERPDRLMRCRPDWVTIVLGSEQEPDEANIAMDVEFLGIMYHPGGYQTGRTMVPLLADEVACWAPTPDPTAAFRGVSWLQPILAEIQADLSATHHKLAFFRNGATPQVIVTVGDGVDKDQFKSWIDKQNAQHAGVMNAYKTLYLKNVASVDVVGKDLAQLDFKATQGAGETRIAAASGVHPVVAALSEGMAGSSLNAGNFNSAKRLVADRTLRPLWRSACAALEVIVPPPAGAELWYDQRDISFLQEDRKDAAEIEQIKAGTIGQLVREGFEPRSVIQAVEAEDMTLLVHTGLVSVQLQPPGSAAPLPPADSPHAAVAAGGARPKVRAFDPHQPRDPDGEWSDGIPGPAGDPLKLAGRIALGPDERFGGSAKVRDGAGDATAVMARVDSPAGPRLRLGVVHPEDEGSWRAANKGRTVELDAAGAARLREVVGQAAADGKKNIAEYRAELRAAHAAGRPASEWPDTEADIASGTITGTRWGDLRWKLTREEGDEYIAGGVNYGPGGEWNLALDPVPAGSAAAVRDNFNATKAPTTSKLDKALADLLGPAEGTP